MNRERLLDLTNRFMSAFNRNDLDAVMSFFAEDAVYDEFNGKRNEGKAAIRAAFTPQFTGAFGDMKFLDEDLFVDPDTGKVMASWRCTLAVKGRLRDAALPQPEASTGGEQAVSERQADDVELPHVAVVGAVPVDQHVLDVLGLTDEVRHVRAQAKAGDGAARGAGLEQEFERPLAHGAHVAEQARGAVAGGGVLHRARSA